MIGSSGIILVLLSFKKATAAEHGTARSRRPALRVPAWTLRRDKAEARVQPQRRSVGRGRSTSRLGLLPLAPYGLRGDGEDGEKRTPKKRVRASGRGLVRPASSCPRAPCPQSGFALPGPAGGDLALRAPLKMLRLVCRVHTWHFGDRREQKVLLHRTILFIPTMWQALGF